MPEQLFEDFSGSSPAEWIEMIEKDLKGRPLDSLNTHLYEGIKVKPFYTREDLPADAGEIHRHMIRSRQTGAWTINQEISHTEPEVIAALLADASANGANAVTLRIHSAYARMSGAYAFKENEFASFENMKDFSLALKSWDPEKTALHLASSSGAPFYFSAFINIMENLDIFPGKIKGSVEFDLFRNLLLRGYFSGGEKLTFESAASMVLHATRYMPGFRTLSLSAAPVSESGGSAVQQIAYLLAASVDYAEHLKEHGLREEQIFSSLTFHLPVNTNFFVEAAKIRAFRWLFSRILMKYGLNPESEDFYMINGRTGKWDLSLYDPHVNLLRTTTSAMSAIMGGCKMVTVYPFDVLYKSSNEFSSRLARNIQLILKEESYLDKVRDAAGGSYYLENLTQSIAENAWKLFLRLEEEGGFISSFRKGFFQNEVHEVKKARLEDIRKRKKTYVGVNNYPNVNEQRDALIRQPKAALKENTELMPPVERAIHSPVNERVRVISNSMNEVDDFQWWLAPLNEVKEYVGDALRRFRGPWVFESIRLKTDKYADETGERPLVYLHTFGNLAMRKARSNFAWNLIGCGGFSLLENPDGDHPEKIEEALQGKKPYAVVLCSSDEDYLKNGIAEAGRIRNLYPDAQLIVAGKAGGFEPKGALFIWKGMDATEFLEKLQQKLMEVENEA